MTRSLRRRLHGIGHTRRYARMEVIGRFYDLAVALGAHSVADALHDRWLLAGLAWEWRLPIDRIGQDVFAELAGQRSQLAAVQRTCRPDQQTDLDDGEE